MLYSLYNSVTNKQYDFANKQALLDWIVTHRPLMADSVLYRFSVYRARKPISHLLPYQRLTLLCSLKQFIVKQKLYLK